MAFRRDEGWAYIVFVASWSIILIISIVDKATGIYYPYMVDYFEESAEKVGFALSMIPALKFTLGLSAAILMERLSCRLITIISSLVMMSGSLLIYFSTSFNHLIIGCISIGFGISYAHFASYYILDVYFKQHFTLAISILALAKGISSTLATPLNQVIIKRYGWKSSYLIITALFYQVLVCTSVFRTPKKVTTEEENDQEMEDIDVNVPQNMANSLKKRLIYIYKLGHFSLFKNSTFLALLAVSFLQGTVTEGILLIMTDDLMERGATLYVSQYIVTFFGLGNLIGRPFHYVCSKVLSDNLIVQLALAFFVGSLSLLICIVTNVEFVVLYISIFLYGFSHGWATTVMPLIMKYHIDWDDFAFGYAWMKFFYGAGPCLGSPVTGFLRDTTGAYWASELLFFVFDSVGLFIVLFIIICQRKHTILSGTKD